VDVEGRHQHLVETDPKALVLLELLDEHRQRRLVVVHGLLHPDPGEAERLQALGGVVVGLLVGARPAAQRVPDVVLVGLAHQQLAGAVEVAVGLLAPGLCGRLVPAV
jgi:hypothetical protein